MAVWSLGPFPVALVNQIVLDPLFALLVYSLAFGRGPLAALFSWPAVVLLGEASYALYLLQWPVHSWLARLYGTPPMHAVPPGARPFVFFIVYLCVAIVLALLAYRFVERPARGALRRLSERGYRTVAANAEAGAAARPPAREAVEG